MTWCELEELRLEGLLKTFRRVPGGTEDNSKKPHSVRCPGGDSNPAPRRHKTDPSRWAWSL